jgi:rare lipoprotein A
MGGRNILLGVSLIGALALAPQLADAQSVICDPINPADALVAFAEVPPVSPAPITSLLACPELPSTAVPALTEALLACPEPRPPAAASAPEAQTNPFQLRALKYAALSVKHKLAGLASYYSTSLDGTLTATGERFRNRRLTAAHLTLPLGSWVEITARATGRKIRVLVNDRGPYAKKFTIDLSQAAARALGVDVAEDRYVDIRVIALPGEQPLPENWDMKGDAPSTAEASAAITRVE